MTPKPLSHIWARRARLQRLSRNEAGHDTRPRVAYNRAISLLWRLEDGQTKICASRIHDLRRTHSTHSAAAGVDLRTLADRIGHSDMTMLHKHYAAVVGDRAVEAAETFQKAFDRMTGEPDGSEANDDSI